MSKKKDQVKKQIQANHKKIEKYKKGNKYLREERDLYKSKLNEPSYRDKRELHGMVQARENQIKLNNQVIASNRREIKKLRKKIGDFGG